MLLVRRLIVALVLIALIVVGFALISPDRVNIQRSITIDAPAATVFSQINDHRLFNRWSPWAEKAPEVTEVEFTGPGRGVGARMRWQSEDPNVGTGEQTITVSEAYERIEVALSFEGQGEAIATYELAPVDGQTQVTWSYKQHFGWSIPGRLIGRLLEKYIGPDYERGLARLKTQAEGLPAADFADLAIKEVSVFPQPLALVETAAEPTSGAIAQSLGQAFFQVLTFMGENGLEQDGAPRKISLGLDSLYRFQAAIPVAGVVEDGSGGVVVAESYQGPALRATHIGPYQELADTHAKINAYVAALGLERNGSEWESYIDDPQQVAVDQLRTEIFYPIKP